MRCNFALLKSWAFISYANTPRKESGDRTIPLHKGKDSHKLVLNVWAQEHLTGRAPLAFDSQTRCIGLHFPKVLVPLCLLETLES